MDFKRRSGGPSGGGGAQAKRSKTGGEWEDSPSQFEEELLLLEEAEMEEEREGQAGHNVIPVGECWTKFYTCWFWADRIYKLLLSFKATFSQPT